MPSGNEYLPYKDSDLVTWAQNFIAVLTPAAEELGINLAQLSPITNARIALTGAIATREQAEATAKATTQAQKNERDNLEAAIRVLVRQIQANPAMTDTLRAQLQITVPNRTRTRRTVGPEVPGVLLRANPGQVVVHFGTDPNNEQQNGKPGWALGCNIYRKRAGEAAFALIAFDTASPYVDHITGPAQDVSYKAAYRGTGANDEGGHSLVQTIAVGG
jgi:hypothetical protein